MFTHVYWSPVYSPVWAPTRPCQVGWTILVWQCSAASWRVFGFSAWISMLAHRSNASHWCQPMLCAQASTWVHWSIWLSTLIHKLWWVHSSLPPLSSLVSHWVHYWRKNEHICTWAVSIDAWTSRTRISPILRFTWRRYIDYALVECDEHLRTISIALQRKSTQNEFVEDEQCLFLSLGQSLPGFIHRLWLHLVWYSIDCGTSYPRRYELRQVRDQTSMFSDWWVIDCFFLGTQSFSSSTWLICLFVSSLFYWKM